VGSLPVPLQAQSKDVREKQQVILYLSLSAGLRSLARNVQIRAIILLESYRMDTTRLSTKGQIVLPKDMRTSRAWGPGTEFIVEERGDGVLLRPVERFPVTNLDQVAGSLRSQGKSRTSRQMQTAIEREAGRRHDRGRY
jgi:AbrB family looped-hinge helix DNA binding protein